MRCCHVIVEVAKFDSSWAEVGLSIPLCFLFYFVDRPWISWNWIPILSVYFGCFWGVGVVVIVLDHVLLLVF